MAIGRYATASPTIGATEYSCAAASTSLPTKTDIGFYALTVDFNALAAGDEYLVQVYEMGVSGGTKRLLEAWPVFGPLGEPITFYPAPGGSLLLGNGWDWTIKKIAGTDRAIPYTLWQVA
jgi:hypothetical protein